MKKKSTLIKAAVIMLFTAFAYGAAAQTATPFPGPSKDAATGPPAAATDVGKVICATGSINLQGPADATGTITYQWYKVDNAGVKKLVKEAKDNTYTETSTDPGYYTYQLVQVSAATCQSDPSDLYRVYVLPPLNPAISGASTVCEKNQTTSTLTITGLSPDYTYTYQWSRNGTPVTTGGTAATYTVSESAAGSVTYSVAVAYTLNTTCTKSATTTITVAPVPVKPTIQFN